MKKSVILVTLLTALILICFVSCGQNSEEGDETSEKISVVATTFPLYDWTRNIVGQDNEKVELTMLIDDGIDLHSYQPTADDIGKISSCDVFIYVGGESDEWVEDALKQAENKNMTVINLLDVLGDSAKEEEEKEGMQEEHHDGEEDAEYDEHVWLSLKNASLLTDFIAGKLSAVDEADADTYRANAEAYIERIKALDEEYTKATEAAAVKTLLFADRFPFRYMVDDYGLDYYAAFAGCSAETEASFETVTFLAGKVDELSLKNVMTIEGGDGKIAETVIKSTKTKDQKILTMDSMQSVTGADVEAGADYISIMEKNLDVLKEAVR